ncbi:HAD family hydrolase [Limnohabitans curvus]|uniref:HAD family hydrolase n=1 Tax=Limnohabitans curvus TaxID=323423 RepID=A0A315G096_9BURK|nr:HAD family phosphatase [Limnohabitans curvus]PUE59087.1 HAD family hydrolase [Limnohabitans curvus]
MTFEAVLFDCDGVLVDSEAITCGALRDMLDENGWRLSLAECMAHFVGHTVRSRAHLIEVNTGKPLTDAFMDEFYRRRNERLENEITAIDGIHDAVRHLHERCEGRIAVASGADRFKVEMMLQRVGLAQFFEGRIFSGHEMPRSKPHPDVYLAAAAHLQMDPARCLVVEDTPVGIAAGVAAGSTVWAYAPPLALTEALTQAGAQRLFAHMNDLRI